MSALQKQPSPAKLGLHPLYKKESYSVTIGSIIVRVQNQSESRLLEANMRDRSILINRCVRVAF